MRVAHILRKYNPAEWGGTETALQRLFEGLHPAGVESVVYAPRLKYGVPPLGGLHFRRVTPDRLKAELHTKQTSDPLAEVGCEINRYRAVVPFIGASRAQKDQMIAVGGNLMSFDLISSLWLEPSIDVVHSHAINRIGGIGLTVARWRKLPFVVTIHGGLLAIPEALRKSFENAEIRGWEWGRFFGALLNSRNVVPQADAILTCNEQEAKLLQDKYPRKRIVVQPHGVAVAAFEKDQRAAALAAFPQLAGKQVLLVPGRVDPVKNQMWVVEQGAVFLRKHPDAVLVLAGACTDAEYGEKLERRIAELGLEERIVRTGGLPPGDAKLIGLFQLASVVLLPSISETFGLIVLEAWAAGTSVIASRTPGASALVKHGVNGWLFDLEKPEGFHEAISIALIRPDVAKGFAAAGHEIVATQYDNRVLARRVAGLYEELITAHNLSPDPNLNSRRLRLRLGVRGQG